MRLGTVSVTERQTNGTVFQRCVLYIPGNPTFRGGNPAQSLMELLIIGVRLFFQLIPPISARKAENPRLCHDPSSSKGDTLVNHFVTNISVFFLREFQSPPTISFLTPRKITPRALFEGTSDLKTAHALRESGDLGPPGFHPFVGLFLPQRSSRVRGIFGKMMAFNSPSDRSSPALSASFPRFSKPWRCSEPRGE